MKITDNEVTLPLAQLTKLASAAVHFSEFHGGQPSTDDIVAARQAMREPEVLDLFDRALTGPNSEKTGRGGRVTGKDQKEWLGNIDFAVKEVNGGWVFTHLSGHEKVTNEGNNIPDTRGF